MIVRAKCFKLFTFCFEFFVIETFPVIFVEVFVFDPTAITRYVVVAITATFAAAVTNCATCQEVQELQHALFVAKEESTLFGFVAVAVTVHERHSNDVHVAVTVWVVGVTNRNTCNYICNWFFLSVVRVLLDDTVDH
ncbi:hypothetical protein D3C87_1696990 [compost metagenome]